jgi:hypothetical protein
VLAWRFAPADLTSGAADIVSSPVTIRFGRRQCKRADAFFPAVWT